MLGKLPCQVHGSERVLEAAVFSGGVNPAGALQLIDITQALHPRRVDQGFFSNFALLFGDGKLNVAMYRVGDQRRPLVFIIVH